MRTMNTVATVAVTIVLAATAATTLAGGQDHVPPPQRCSVASLQGAYGLQWVGTRPVPQPPGTPPVIETFTGIAVRTFDGAGNFTQVSNVKGSAAGLEAENIESFGTYEVNGDCSGTATSQFVPGGPIVTVRLVIVDDGDEVLQSVMTPVPIFNAGVLRKIHTRRSEASVRAQ